ncbi:MAG: hypothetical protein ACRC67_09490 [Inquilinus sp.]|uniref:hypothetical protein n=1 Tax=Inquilinus sp. TaxID=1932117 RepID=UPI003F3CE586
MAKDGWKRRTAALEQATEPPARQIVVTVYEGETADDALAAAGAQSGPRDTVIGVRVFSQRRDGTRCPIPMTAGEMERLANVAEMSEFHAPGILPEVRSRHVERPAPEPQPQKRTEPGQDDPDF